jgi:L-ribulose-5-phosphate 4-epimerase
MKEEGVIKFNCHWIKEEPIKDAFIEEINAWRDRLYALGLIGVTEDGIGYGNLSQRLNKDQFIITGSGTGKLEKLSAAHYTRVTAYDFMQNSVTTAGPIIASSETLTHAMIYRCRKNINAVFHVHHHALWKKLLRTLPSTANNVPYGTPEMAKEVDRLLQEMTNPNNTIFAMAGHEDGVVAFGKDPDAAGNILLDHLKGMQ